MGLLVDMGMIMGQTACRTRIAAVEPHARNRVNTVFMAAGFVGMLVGTAVANRLYAEGGWHYSGAAEIAFLVVALILSVAIGPHETGWIGWSGGWRPKPAIRGDASPDVESNRKRRRQSGRSCCREEGRTGRAGHRAE